MRWLLAFETTQQPAAAKTGSTSAATGVSSAENASRQSPMASGRQATTGISASSSGSGVGCTQRTASP